MKSPELSPTAAEPASEPGAAVATARYRVFLSYSHTDTKWAQWLMRRLEGYRVPERFHGRAAPIGEVGLRIAPVFRDRDELPTADDLGEAVQGALRESATLVVVCSPAAARSRWVNEEVMYFKRIGRGDRVFAFIVAGEPNATDEAQECFPPALRFEVGTAGVLPGKPVELIAADARPHADGKEDAFVRLVAGLLGVGFDELRRREHARRLRRMMWITGGSVAGMALTLGLALYAMKARNDAVVARNDAQRRQENSEAVMAKMLEGLEARLKKADQLEALDEAGKNVMAYFQSLNPRDLTDKSNMQQAKLLTQIGQMRIAQLHFGDATTSFTAALSRTAALVARHPRDGEARFERAQAEFWIGNVHYKQGNYAHASEWFVRYRDTGVALTELDPSNVKWQREAVSGHHNLAVLELARGNLAAARQGFLREHAALEKMTMSDPLEASELQASIANVDSFLGSVAERMGDFREAVARFNQQIDRIDALVKADPRSARMKQRLAMSFSLVAEPLIISGQRQAGLDRRRRATELFEQLSAQDPANREWQVSTLSSRVRYVGLLLAAGEKAEAHRLVKECRPALEKLAQGATTSRAVSATLAHAWRVEARMSESVDDSMRAAAKAVGIAQGLLEHDRADENNLFTYAQALMAAGHAAGRAGDTVAARQHVQTAFSAVESRAKTSTHWRVLDPAVRALVLLGRDEESRSIRERLAQLGYEPIEPWPDTPTP